MVALTTEGLVFTWGEGKKGQLGHGQVDNLVVLRRLVSICLKQSLWRSRVFLSTPKIHMAKVENWRSRPTCVEALKGKAITRVAAGNGFSVSNHI